MRGSASYLVRVGALVVGLSSLPACDSATECEEDSDGDGYGPGCRLGDDCDDSDPSRHAGCGAVDCEADRYGAGCPCQGSAVHACFSGPETALSFGACKEGTQHCSRAAWTACDGEVPPLVERCDGEDNDCDGVVDEGVLSPCGGCEASCVGDVWGGPTVPFEAAGTLVLNDQDQLTLAYDELNFAVLWVANTDEGTVSRIDSSAFVETARYAVPGLPRRVAVDYSGAAFLLSEDSAGSYLTKVAPQTDACLDVAGDGFDTSRGPDDVLALGEDDCALFTRRIGDADTAALALAIDGTRRLDGFVVSGDAWVATARPPRVLHLSGETGELVESLSLPFAEPQDAAFDLAGRLWILDRGGRILRLAYQGREWQADAIDVPRDCYRLEALTIDVRGRLFMSTFDCESVLSFEPSSNRFLSVASAGFLTTRGIAAIADKLYVSHTSGSLSQLGKTPLAFEETLPLSGELGDAIESVGLASNGLDTVWSVSRAATESELGVVTQVDSTTMEVSAQLQVGLGPRALGDFAGARLLGSYAAEGSQRRVFEGCRSGDTRWRALHVRYSAGPGGEVQLAVRRANTSAQLAAATFDVLGTFPQDAAPLPLTDLPQGGVIEVRMTLRAGSHTGAPLVSQVGVQWQCGGVLE